MIKFIIYILVILAPISLFAQGDNDNGPLELTAPIEQESDNLANDETLTVGVPNIADSVAIVPDSPKNNDAKYNTS